MFHKKYDYDLLVLGSGGGGSVAAHHARTLGKKVAIFERGHVGGECPNFACVPTKALLHAAKIYAITKDSKQFGVAVAKSTVDYPDVKKWKNLVVARTGASHGDEALEKDGIHLIKEKAAFVSAHEVTAGGKTYSAAKFLIATGSRVFIPPVPGLGESGYLTFKDAVSLSEPPKSLLIFGGGAVGCEFAQIFSTFGTKVTIVNRSDHLLGKEEKEVSDLAKALFGYAGITVLTGTTMVKVEKKQGKKYVHLKQGGKNILSETDEILIATGKVPMLDCGLEYAGITVRTGRLRVNRYLQTEIPHIFAAGDVIGPYLFTHTANYQGYIAAHNAFSREKIVPDYRVVPRCVFLFPEVASVGMTEDEAKEKKITVKKGIVPVAVLGRANTENTLDGFVKILTDKRGYIIGGSIVAPRAGEMIHEVALAMKLRAKASDLASMIHAYPTYSEAIKMACSVVS